MKNEITIHHHLGLGDTIECNGIVRYYAEKYDKVHVFSKERNYNMISYMYRDNQNIVVHKVPENNEYAGVSKFLENFEGSVLVPGHQNYFRKDGWGPGETFYHLANVPWECRNSKFFFERDLKKEQEVCDLINPDKERYIFVHDDPSRGFNLNIDTPYKIIKNNPSVNMFNIVKLLEEAEEIHCMSSSILCLIDCLSTSVKFPKLYLHYNIRKVELGPKSLFGDWEYVF
jgi:hypothetical protein